MPIFFVFYHDLFKCSIQQNAPNAVVEYFKRVWRPLSFKNQSFTFLSVKKIAFIDFGKKTKKPEPFSFPIESNVKILENLSIVKSCLQKAIRRQDVKMSLMAAKCMMKLSVRPFLRRLVIICAEDTYLDVENFTFLIFLFKALENKDDFFLDKRIVDYLLGLVKVIALEERFENFSKFEHISTMDVANPFSVAMHIFKASTEFFLPGDGKMLNWYHEQYISNTEKICRNKKFSREIVPVDVHSIEWLTITNCPLYAVDFHTSMKMPDALSKRLSLPQEKIKSLIWENRSKLNKRKHDFSIVQDEETWKLIEPELDKYCRNSLKYCNEFTRKKI